MSFHTARVAPENAVFRPALPSCFLPGMTEMQMAKMSYAEQLKHPNWQRKRLEALQSADFQCTSCSDKDSMLHVHHKRYVKGRMAWEYETSELQVLCEKCHGEAHKTKENLEALLLESFRDMPLHEFAYGFLCGFLMPFNEKARQLWEEAYAQDPASFELGLAMAALGPADMAAALQKKIAEGRLPGEHPILEEFISDWAEG